MNEYRDEPSESSGPRPCQVQTVVEQDPICEAGQRIVERLMRER